MIEEYLSKARHDAGVPLSERKDRRGDGRVRFTNVSVLNNRYEVVETVISGQDISISLDYEIPGSETLDNAIVSIKFAGVFGQPLFACLSRTSRRESLALVPGARLYCNIPVCSGAGHLYVHDWVHGLPYNGRLRGRGRQAISLDGDFLERAIVPPRTVGDFSGAHLVARERQNEYNWCSSRPSCISREGLAYRGRSGSAQTVA